MNGTARIIAVIPLAWGDEALLETTGAAQQISVDAGCGFDVVLLGGAAQPSEQQRAILAAAGRIQLVAHDMLESGDNLPALATAAARALTAPTEQQLLLVPPGADGEELAALLAAQLDCALLGRCTRAAWDGEAWLIERAVWGGRQTLSLRLTGQRGVASLRLGRAQRGTAEPATLDVLHIQESLPEPLEIEQTRSEQRLAPVQGARLVVSGGRGVNEQGFAQLEELAARLDAALGGSLPAVDAGMVPVARQVGISGHFVSAEVYLAVGISGTPQHLAGISNATCILAVNKDPAADIFKVANVGVVAEWEQLLPALLAQLPG
ncbi:MAG: FAD-binding protein [Pseudomonas sp.]